MGYIKLGQYPTINIKVTNTGESTYVETPEFMMHQGMDGKHDFAIHLKNQ